MNADTVEPWHDFLLPSSSAGELEHELQSWTFPNLALNLFEV